MKLSHIFLYATLSLIISDADEFELIGRTLISIEVSEEELANLITATNS